MTPLPSASNASNSRLSVAASILHWACKTSRASAWNLTNSDQQIWFVLSESEGKTAP